VHLRDQKFQSVDRNFWKNAGAEKIFSHGEETPRHFFSKNPYFVRYNYALNRTIPTNPTIPTTPQLQFK
jgi:hypothetical protein